VTAFFFALLLLILYGAFLILTPFLTAITWAVILAILFYPVYAALLELMRGRATLAAMTVIVVITIIVIAPGVELARFLADEAVSLLQSVRLLLGEDGKQQWLAQPWVQHLIGWWDMATFRLVDFKIDWKNLLIQGAQSSSTFIVTQVKGIAQNVLLFTVNFIVALFTLFFFLRDGAELVRRIQRLLPMDREHQQRLFKNIVDSVLAVVHGSLVVAMVQGLLAGLAYWFLGVPYAVLWGVVTAFFSRCRWVGRRSFRYRPRFTCFSRAKRCAESCCWFGAWDLSARWTIFSSRFSSAIVSACRSYFSFSASLAVSRFSVWWGSCSVRRC